MVYLSSPSVFSQSPIIDANTGIISNVVLVQEGPAKGHGLNINSVFIDKVIDQGNQSKIGIKARFGHPNICATALGTYLGRYYNFRKVGQSAVADLKLDPVAKKSPNGDLFSYVIEMAQNNPDMFGASISFKRGKSVFVKDEDGKKTEYATIESLYAGDFVDSPAATDGLFDVFHADDLAFQVTSFLDAHPEILTILANKPEIIDSFLAKYKPAVPNFKFADSDTFLAKVKSLRNWVSSVFTKLSESNPDNKQQISDLTSVFNTQLSVLQDEFTSQSAEFELLTTEFNSLKASPSFIKFVSDPPVSLNKPKPQSESFLTEVPPDVKARLNKKLKSKK